MYRVKREIEKTGGRFPLARVFRDREGGMGRERRGRDFRVVTMFFLSHGRAPCLSKKGFLITLLF